MTATGVRFLRWMQRRAVLIAATTATVGFVAFMSVVTFRLYDERQLRVDAIAEQARMNRMINLDLCEGLNESNGTLRFLLDGSIRGRTATSAPLSDAQRQLTIEIYRRLPSTDCETGEKTYYDPPFPSFPTGGS